MSRTWQTLWLTLLLVFSTSTLRAQSAGAEVILTGDSVSAAVFEILHAALSREGISLQRSAAAAISCSGELDPAAAVSVRVWLQWTKRLVSLCFQDRCGSSERVLGPFSELDASDKLLGVEAVALALSSARGLTLERLASAGMLSAPPNPLHIAVPEDSTGLAAAALGYLHANCGMPCHSSRGLGHETELLMRLRADEIWPADGAARDATTMQSYRAMVNQPAVTGAVTNAFPDALRVTPGDHMHSLVWLLANRRGDYQMPPLVSHRVDDNAMQNIASWIDALKVP